ncbi:glycosyltransferase family 2 protein [Chroococcidiopsis sp. TS-821]|uniref:glycosyltransferase family 2 protein n=1 Tax=Chroococcidiopsis sp. TS-821 TaxID=1378066 RepID=UPI000CEE9ADD|nr:glycosyltransferase [Chroococcidiopsis sp. TS-821]PPS45651.1 glycosyl transferase [Chroococcidiopsis sp. TS-821]
MTSSTHQELLFSIIIPTYARPDRLKNCLHAIAQLDYPRDRFEVIVVDDGSPMSLEPVVAPFSKRLTLTLLKQVNSGPATARNHGAAKANGKFLVFTDDDCAPASTWLTALEKCFETAPESLIGGKTLNALPNNLFSTASQLLIDYLYAYYNSTAQQAQFFASNNFALSAKLFRTLGGFDTTFPLAAGEDREFCDRLLHYGYSMLYAPEVQVYHAHKLSLRSFWRQHFNYGRGAFCFHQARSRRNVERIKVEPLSFYFNLLRYPLLVRSHHSVLVSALFVLSQIANIAGFFWERFNQKSKSFIASQTVV